MRDLVAACVAGLFLALAAVGRSEAPAVSGVRALRSWWTTREFEASAARDDELAALRAAERLLLSGTDRGDALLFMLHRVGIDRTAPSRRLPASQARELAKLARDTASRHRAVLDDPAAALRLRVFVLAGRLLPLTSDPELRARWSAAARRDLSDLLAAGGGGAGLALDPGPYRAWLALPPAARVEWLDRRLATLRHLLRGEHLGAHEADPH